MTSTCEICGAELRVFETGLCLECDLELEELEADRALDDLLAEDEKEPEDH